MRSSLACLLLALTGCRAAPAARSFEYVERHMGCMARVLVVAPGDASGEASARSAARAAFDELARCDLELSDYLADNGLARLAQHAGDGTWVEVGERAVELARRAQAISAACDGQFDVTIGPLTALWRVARDTGRAPEPAELERARAAVDWRAIEFDGATRLRLARAGMRLDFGGIGKGYAAGRALEVLRAAGRPQALVGLAGDLALGEPPPGEPGWRIDVPGAPGTGVLTLGPCHVSTSSGGGQLARFGGAEHGHILDPRTGASAPSDSTIAVIAADGATADAAATLACSADLRAGLRWAAALGVQLYGCGPDGPLVTHTESMATPEASQATRQEFP